VSFLPKSPATAGGDAADKSQTNWRFLDFTLLPLLGMTKKIVLQHPRKREPSTFLSFQLIIVNLHFPCHSHSLLSFPIFLFVPYFPFHSHSLLSIPISLVIPVKTGTSPFLSFPPNIQEQSTQKYIPFAPSVSLPFGSTVNSLISSIIDKNTNPILPESPTLWIYANDYF